MDAKSEQVHGCRCTYGEDESACSVTRTPRARSNVRIQIDVSSASLDVPDGFVRKTYLTNEGEWKALVGSKPHTYNKKVARCGELMSGHSGSPTAISAARQICFESFDIRSVRRRFVARARLRSSCGVK